jgi:hypothetical protein
VQYPALRELGGELANEPVLPRPAPFKTLRRGAGGTEGGAAEPAAATVEADQTKKPRRNGAGARTRGGKR